MEIPEGSDGKLYCRPVKVPSVDFVSLGAATGDLGLRSAPDEVKQVKQEDIKVEDNKDKLFIDKGQNKFMTKETLDIIKAKYPSYLQMAVEASVEGKTDEEVLALCEAKMIADAAIETENKLKEYATKVSEFETLVADLKKQLGEKETKLSEYSEKFNKLGANPIDLGTKPELVDTKNKLEIYYSIKDSVAQTEYFNKHKDEIAAILASQ
jgi:molecular chaperone DnaK (HSP70)